MSFAWRKWKLGIVVSIVLSLLVAGSGLAAGIKWQAFVAVLCTALLTHVGAFLKDHPVDAITFDEDNQKSDPMKKIVPLFIFLAVCACLFSAGCVTRKVTTITPGGVSSTGASLPATTNVMTIVDTNNLTIDAGLVRRATAAMVLGAFKIPAVQKDAGVIPALKDAETALNGVLNGTNPQSTSEILGLLGSAGNDSLAAQVSPLIDFASALEQGLLIHYGASVAGQITTAFAGAVRDGLADALAGK